MVTLMEEMEPLFALLQEAAKTDHFSRPPREAYLPDLMLPQVSGSRHFAWFIWARIDLLQQEGEIAAAQELLQQFRKVYLKSLAPGTLIEFLVYNIVARDRHGKAYSLLSAENLEENLANQLRFLESIPSFLEWIEPEKWFQYNTLATFLSEETRAEQEALRLRILERIDSETETGRKVLQLIEEKKVLHVENWAEDIVSELDHFHEKLAPALAGPREDYESWMDKIYERWTGWTGDVQPHQIAASFNVAIETTLAGEDLSKEQLIELDENVSTLLKGTYLSIILPGNYYTMADMHRLLIGSERLLAIHLAADLYQKQNDHKPENLNDLTTSGLIPVQHLIDPFSGESFRLRTEPHWQPYSVGVNRQDNDGTFLNWQDLRKGEEGDLMLFPSE